ncbi:sigma-54-dependent Fis family transcriptional regulator [Collibacillus ludicampi]|uniref:Sigma-54-dependent Fis family transcriptional regulator n=1 Tax=Collibacillus ludicampi TaxID=2771369 RepID=A0AAV4LAX7_9BACL|nr:sigma 54-interacting transcriptional regulator [Collibacillus ludicampi]GIM44933.1 sigma-54-dependent Fis family transcriptional regulator [Collibacillus ludicampi]
MSSLLHTTVADWMETLINDPSVSNYPTVRSTTPFMEWIRLVREDTPDFLVTDENGHPIGILSVTRVLPRVAEAWAKTQAFFETLLDTISEAVTVVDHNGIVTHWNKSAEDLYAISNPSIVGQSIHRFEWKSLMIARILDEGRNIRQIYHEPRPGTHVLVNASPVFQGQEIIGALASEQDVTKLVRLHNELFSTSAQLRDLEQELAPNNQPFHKIKGSGPAITHAISLAKRVAVTDATVLISGESGVGKELFAHAIHSASPRREGPFVAINCGAIPAALFESELFGYQGGAFTGADRKGKPGKLELAHGGTLFLDEVGELPLDMQVKLLRVLQDQVVYRVGGTQPIQVNVRIVAATNRALEEEVKKGNFREDLYYRLNVVSLEIPPLRERVEDIPELVQLFAKEFAQQYGKPMPRFDPEVIVIFMNYHWPGNIRQLRNVIERLIILHEGEWIRKEHLPLSMQGPSLQEEPPVRTTELVPSPATGETTLQQSSEIAEKSAILSALQKTYGNKSAAARMLGISRGTLYNKMKQYGLL